MPLTMPDDTRAKIYGDLLKQRLDEAASKSPVYLTAFSIFLVASAALLAGLGQSTAIGTGLWPTLAAPAAAHRAQRALAIVGLVLCAVNIYACRRQRRIASDLSDDIRQLNVELGTPVKKPEPETLRAITTCVLVCTWVGVMFWLWVAF